MNEGLILIHHGIRGQKWGVRRYQNEDGSLTEAGRKRIDDYTRAYITGNAERSVDRIHLEAARETNRRLSEEYYNGIGKKLSDNYQKAMKKQGSGMLNSKDYNKYHDNLKSGMKEIDKLFNKYAKYTADQIIAQTGISSYETRRRVKEIVKGYANGQKNWHKSDFYLNIIEDKRK